MKNKMGVRKAAKPKGINNPQKTFTVPVKEEIVAPSEKSNSLTSRTVKNQSEQIKTYVPTNAEPLNKPSNLLTSKKEVWPVPKKSMDLTSRKEILQPSRRAKPEPEPYSEDSYLHHEICSFHNRCLGHYQAIAAGYEKLNIGCIDLEIFHQIQSRNLSQIKSRYYKILDDEMEKMHLTNPVLIHNFKEGADEPFLSFENVVKTELDQIAQKQINSGQNIIVNISHYTIKSDKIEFTEANKEYLLNTFCRSFLDSDAKKNFVKKVDETLKNFSELKSILNKNGGRYVFGGLDSIFELNPATQEIIFNKKIVNLIRV